MRTTKAQIRLRKCVFVVHYLDSIMLLLPGDYSVTDEALLAETT